MTYDAPFIARRRGLVQAGLAAAAGLACGPALAAVPASRGSPGFYRFGLGEATVTVISDGRAYSSDPKRTFSGAPPAEIDAAMTSHFLDASRVVMDENVVVIDFPGRRVMFDCGSGTSTLFGPDGGRLIGNLETAGISRGSIDAIVLSHGHPDHIGALMDDAGERNFPNASLHLNETEYTFWTDPARTGPKLAAFHNLAMRQLPMNRDRLHMVADGQEVLPGIQAVASPGHTVGHTHFLVSSGNQVLAVTADLTRHPVLGLEHRWAFAGDYDAELSLASLDRHMGQLADDRVQILSYHYPWPGLGHVTRWGDRFRYVPTAMDMS